MLVYIAAKLHALSERIFAKAVSLVLTNVDPNLVTAKTQPEPEKAVQEEVVKSKLQEALDRAKEKGELLPSFNDPAGDPIPLVFDELPSFKLFKAMFVRKYGPNGVCPLTVGGRVKAFDSETLYELLKKISEEETSAPVHLALYGTVMNVVMHAYGEDFEDSDWN